MFDFKLTQQEAHPRPRSDADKDNHVYDLIILGGGPGFPDGIAGQELAQRFQGQAERFGVRIELDNVTAVDFSARPFTIHTYGTT